MCPPLLLPRSNTGTLVIRNLERSFGMPECYMGVYSQTSPMVWGLLGKNDWTYEACSEEDIRMSPYLTRTAGNNCY